MELLERDSCLRQLDDALKEAVAGAGRVALVGGEAGIGKTALVERFVDDGRASARALWGACDALFTPRPLGPLHDIALQTQGNLLRLLTSDADRFAIYSACLAELQDCPTIAVFEDVHWADEATLDLLRFLGRRIARTPALLILTYRDDELGPRHPLRALLGDLARSPAARRVWLPPLTEKAVRALVGEQAIDASALYRQTGGNPFFVTEVLGHTSRGIPATVRDAVLARAARLSPSSQAVLQAAAVIGPRIEPWVLAEVAGAEATAADECLAVGALVAHGDVLAFRHDLARQTILESISPPQRLALHRTTLEALQASPATRADLARLAHHAEAAGDRQAVLEYAPAAARHAATAGAHREAAALYGLALRFADDWSPADYAGMLQLYADECNLAERQPDAIAAWRQALEIWRGLQDRLKQGEVLAALTIMLRNSGSYAEAEQTSSAAIEMLEGLPPSRALARAWRARATLRAVNRDHAEAIEWGERALPLAEQFEDADTWATAGVAVGSAWMFLDYERGRAYLERLLERVRAAGQEGDVANTLAYLSSTCGELYRFDHAEHYLAEGIAYAAERGLDVFHRFLLAWQALTHLHRGRWDATAEAANESLQSPAAPAISSIPALVALGRLRARRGDPGAEDALDEALELATKTASLPHLGPVCAARAEAAWLAGDEARTLEEARAAYNLAASKRHPWFTGELAYWRWRAGDEAALPEWTAQPFALQIAGDWRAAAGEWERLGCPYEQARALADGDRDAQTAAISILDQLGARPAFEKVRHNMLAAGAPVPRGPRPATRENPFGLTARQVEVLRLLTQGLSNAEIAARLHISPKTADHHVSAVLAKLAVHSREAAAALAKKHPFFAPK